MELSYREWQLRNTQLFRSLDRQHQQQLRDRGYCNVSWAKVKYSWELLQSIPKKVTSMVEAHLRRGNLQGAIDCSRMEIENACNLARIGIQELEETYHKMTDLADRVVERYKLL